ncbi:hypothetical protein PANT_6c00044 [Moesziomyces antarcticus T-34]|uniref:Glycosyltransferase family 31 protein n=1 Tax=Pseudozyma antarctica (strain T-34) TaxID=1151754 RepID=M9LKR4_PSEA3|nr:hypothetical protein PANT_6c00044 [Moesziomyces antarcticus T-34]
MSDDKRDLERRTPHIVVPYTDDEEASSSATTTLLPQPQASTSTSKSRRRCWRLAVLVGAMLAMCIGVFELLFHGREVESLRAAHEQIAQLKHDLSEQIQGGYHKIMAATSLSPSTSSHVDPKLKAVMEKSVIVLKTGSSVAYDRLPVQLLLAQQALHPEVYRSGEDGYKGPQLLLYSDAEMHLGEFAVHNALANVSDYVQKQPDFARQYAQLQKLLQDDNLARVKEFQDGWNLDKWKFLYMWQDAYHRQPEAEWYIGYEADTYVLWPSLFAYLGTQNSSQHQMYGCASILVRNQELFANGGCPYVISGALMRATFGKDADFAAKFDKEVEASCCGDAELSIALRKSASPPIQELAPTGGRFVNERPQEITFDENNFCEPVFNFHHLTPTEIQWLANMERQIRTAKPNAPVLYADIFDHVLPHKLLEAVSAAAKKSKKGVELNPMLEDWEAFGSGDNGVKKGKRSKDVEKCKAECVASEGCTTWFWIKVTETDEDGDCYMLRDRLRVGKAYKGTGVRTSGWIGERVLDFKNKHECKNPPTV